MFGIGEAKDQVDADQDRQIPQPLAAERAEELPVAHEIGHFSADQAEDRARKRPTEGPSVAEHIPRDVARQAGNKVDHGEPERAVEGLDIPAQAEQRPAVEGQVRQAAVQEDRAEQPPVLTGARPSCSHCAPR